MTITISTGDLCGILGDCIPFALPSEDLPVLNAVRLEWDGDQLHALATDQVRIAWSTWDPGDDPDVEGAFQPDLMTEYGGADDPWSIMLPLPDAKELERNFRLKPKERGCPLTVDFDDGQLRVDRSRNTGHSALRMVVAADPFAADWPDVRGLLAKHSTAAPLLNISYTARLLADFGKVRPRGPLRLTFTGETKPTLVEIGKRFVGAIQPVREENE